MHVPFHSEHINIEILLTEIHVIELQFAKRNDILYCSYLQVIVFSEWHFTSS